MAINKVLYGETPLVDMTDATLGVADGDKILNGETAYGKDGQKITGSVVTTPVDAHYDATSANAQAGTAVAEAIATKATLETTVAQTAGQLTQARVEEGDKQILFDKSGNIIDFCITNGQFSNTEFLATKGYVDTSLPSKATESTLGTIKLNSAQSIGLDADGKLTVGGRMGQFPTTTGLFAPNNRDPRSVGDYSLLMTDALGVDMQANRSEAVVSGYGIACKSAAAGATEYRITNNYANRIIAKLCEGGYASRDEATSKVERIIPVLSVTINGAAFTPDSAANSSSDIVITTESTLNPDSAISNIRLFGTMQSYATLHIGNGIKSEAGGRSLVLGGGVTKAGSVNDNCLIGNGIFSNGNGNAAFGRYHICRKNRGFFAGTGHDSTNAPSEGASAVGQYSLMNNNTLFAVGNGSSHTARSNAFEVTSDSGVVLKSPNGTRYKITVDDSGNIRTTAL